jgi:four helix bundle protein
MFAVEICNLARRLPATSEASEVASQLRRAGRGVASNYRAARRGRSDEDFIAKIGVVIEEADEAMYWLEHLAETKVMTSDAVETLRAEANELVAIFTAAQKTARQNLPKKQARRLRERQDHRRPRAR